MHNQVYIAFICTHHAAQIYVKTACINRTSEFRPYMHARTIIIGALERFQHCENPSISSPIATIFIYVVEHASVSLMRQRNARQS